MKDIYSDLARVLANGVLANIASVVDDTQPKVKQPKSADKEPKIMTEQQSNQQKTKQFNICVPSIKHQRLHERLKVSTAARMHALYKQLNTILAQQRYWYISVPDGDKRYTAIYDTSTKMLWYDVVVAWERNGYSKVNRLQLLNWRVPTANEVEALRRGTGNSTFPLYGYSRFALIDNRAFLAVLVDDNIKHIDVDTLQVGSFDEDTVLLCNDHFASSDQSWIDYCIEYQPLIIHSVTKDQAVDDRLASLIKELSHLFQKGRDLSVEHVWREIDYISTRLPVLDELCFTDIERGMWEFYQPANISTGYEQVANHINIRARNPEQDIRDDAKVAIDFGTSSTVVAIRQNGRDELLRIGLQAQDFKDNTISDNDFENPTILELKNIEQLLTDWHSESYRPLVDWNTVSCSHEARNRLRSNDSDARITSSIFARIKQWALRDEHQAKVRITDQKNGREHEFMPLTEYNPVKGQSITLGENYPQLDPIELYAWFLGMNINWRERGIFLKYYMTFPVEYPRSTKEKILSSFRRGLQRSLPESLIYSEKFNDFSVQELASEPAAFAAAALRTLNVEPDQQGKAYGVFDFGGGTTDFDYGIYREANDEEYDLGYDDVIEHFGASGDKFLGGENLLENLAYLVFQHNAELCRANEISFTKPIDVSAFVGSELLIAQTQAAYTNTTLLMSKLRPFWEKGQVDDNAHGALRLKLLNRQGQKVDCELEIIEDELMSYLKYRIQQGFIGFFTALKSSFDKHQGALPEQVHVLLGGNSSRSQIVSEFLQSQFLDSDRLDNRALTLSEDSILRGIFVGDKIPTFIIHEPLQSDTKNPFIPNTKTGVALGLLKVSPGETLKVINHAENNEDSDSPFQFYVGSHRRDRFVVGIKRGESYGKWFELGRVRQGIFPLLYTTQAQAELSDGMLRGSNGLYEKNIEFSGADSQGKSVFAKIIAPDTIEVGLAEDMTQIDQLQSVQHIRLSH